MQAWDVGEPKTYVDNVERLVGWVVNPCTAHILVWSRSWSKVLICKFQVSSWEELVGPQHKAAQEQTSTYVGWAIITAELQRPRSRGPHEKVPSIATCISLENLASSPSQASNALIVKKFSYSCFEHTCVKSRMEILLSTMTPRWCTCMVSLTWRVSRSSAPALCHVQLGIFRRTDNFPFSLPGGSTRWVQGFPPDSAAFLPPTQLGPGTLINPLCTSRCSWGGSWEVLLH